MAESPTKKQETAEPAAPKESPQNEEVVVAKTELDKPTENGDKPKTEEAAKSAELTEVCAPTITEDEEPPIPDFVEPPVSVKDVDITDDWSAADSVAVDCPLTIRRTVKHLTDHFKSKELVGLHLARAAFRWITCHIQWKHGGSQEPDSVLRKGGGEDAGFCSLFAAMCSECGLTTKTVSGYVKDSGYVPGTVPDSNTVKQYWNTLEVEPGVFLTVDCLRAAGFVRNGKFEPV
eukprot:sb/3469363/